MAEVIGLRVRILCVQTDSDEALIDSCGAARQHAVFGTADALQP